jgi:hypothetical protein
MKKSISICLIFCCCFSTSYSQAGSLDTSFGTKGIVRTRIGAAKMSWANGIEVLTQSSDGSIYLLVRTTDEATIIRFLPNGSVDVSYGTDGYSVSMPIDPSSGVLQSDGKIVIAGVIFTMVPTMILLLPASIVMAH